MNILHITTYLQGGAGRIIRDLAVMQKKNGNNVTIIINNKEEIGYENYIEYINDLREEEIEFYMVDSTFKRDIYLNIQASAIVNEVIKKNNIDIIHTHATTPSMIGMLGKNNINSNIPIIQTMHGWGTNKNEKHEKMDVTILNMVNRVVTVSKADEALLISKGVQSKKITTIYNGIEDKIYNDSVVNNIKSDLLKRRKSGNAIIGCIGSVCKRKNQEMVIKALKYMKEANVEVIFLGEGKDITELENLANSYGVFDKVKFYGYVDRAYLYIKYFDYIILPSLSEGLPLTILESFREKKPVIVSNIPVFTEIINHDKNGLIFDISNIDELVRVMKRAIEIKNSDEYVNMSSACKEDFESKYKLIDMYNKYMNEYIKLSN